MTSSHITTNSGEIFDFFDPVPSAINIEDISFSLSHLARWNGHSDTPYSVLAHSVAVSYIVEALGGSREDQLKGLLHDASEAYGGDIASPIKKKLPDFSIAENRLIDMIFTKFGVSEGITGVVHQADRMSLVHEAMVLFKDNPWWITKEDIDLYESHSPWIPDLCRPGIDSFAFSQDIRSVFLKRFSRLCGVKSNSDT